MNAPLLDGLTRRVLPVAVIAFGVFIFAAPAFADNCADRDDCSAIPPNVTGLTGIAATGGAVLLTRRIRQLRSWPILKEQLEEEVDERDYCKSALGVFWGKGRESGKFGIWRPEGTKGYRMLSPEEVEKLSSDIGIEAKNAYDKVIKKMGIFNLLPALNEAAAGSAKELGKGIAQFALAYWSLPLAVGGFFGGAGWFGRAADWTLWLAETVGSEDGKDLTMNIIDGEIKGINECIEHIQGLPVWKKVGFIGEDPILRDLKQLVMVGGTGIKVGGETFSLAMDVLDIIDADRKGREWSQKVINIKTKVAKLAMDSDSVWDVKDYGSQSWAPLAWGDFLPKGKYLMPKEHLVGSINQSLADIAAAVKKRECLSKWLKAAQAERGE